jgi:hypothetical protein
LHLSLKKAMMTIFQKGRLGCLIVFLLALLAGCVPPPPRAGHQPPKPPHPAAFINNNFGNLPTQQNA